MNFPWLYFIGFECRHVRQTYVNGAGCYARIESYRDDRYGLGGDEIWVIVVRD
jgi:hypothetical protein